MRLVDVRRNDAVWTIVLNRPERRNALNPQLQTELLAALGAFDRSTAARVAVLTCADPAFCAGMDLRELGAGTLGFSDDAHYSTTMRAVRKPIIGAVNGAAVAGGFELALACDFLIASERAWFADSHAEVGVLPGGGLTPYLTQTVGVRQGGRISLTGERVPAERALQVGLVTEVVPHDQLLPRATEVAATIAARDDAVVAAIRASYERALNLPADAAFAADAAASRAAGIPTETIADLADRLLPGEATSEATSPGTQR
jgi:enoyl-CoA hydratase/carnithine racemase